jgi:hypothetical protein
MKDLPLTLRPTPLKALLASGRTTARFRRPIAGRYAKLAPGDLLWLREQFYLPSRFNSRSPLWAEDQGAQPTFAVDLAGRDPNELGLGLSRISFHLPRCWSRFHFKVLAVRREPLGAITEEEARADGFTNRTFWLEDWDHLVSSVGGRARWRLAEANPDVLVIDTQFVRAPLDAPFTEQEAA